MEPLGVEKVPIDAHVGVRPRSRPDVGRRMERKVEKEAMKRSGSCDWSEKADVDHESDAGSVADEDRLKRLFDTCDTDGDGYITCEDLLYICQELSLEDCFDDIISQLGMQMNSRISFEEFVKCRIALNSEIEALRQESSSAPSATGDSSSGIYPLAFRHGDGASNASGTNTNDYIPTSSENSLERGGLGLVKKQFGDSWEFDSGARDLSPEPRSLQKLLENAGAILPGSSSHLLDVANKLHLAAVTGQRAELLELSSRLQVLSRDKENLTKALAKAQVSLVKVLARDEDRLALYGADTFLIQNEKVEMAHRYEARLTELHSVIAELGRKQEAHQASMIQEEELEEVEEVEEVEELEDQLEDHLENRLEEQLEEQEAEEEEPNCKESEDCAEKDEFRIPQPLEAAAASSPAAHLNEGTLGSSEREEGEAERLRSSLDILRRENAFLRKKLFELEPAGEEERTGGVELVTRVAERIRLRRVEQGDKHLSGSDISAFGGVSSTRMAEHLAEDIRKDSSTQELFNALAGCALPEMQVKEFEVELERLNAKMEHLRAENDVLSLTLEETKSQCNHLSVLLGRYESNCTALRLALTCTEQVVEAYEALLGLLESELGMLMANCRLAGVLGSRSSDEDAQETLKKAVHGKAHKENAAQRVLVSLATADRLYPSPSRTSIGSTGSGSSGGRSDGMGGGGEDKQLKAHISRLKREKKRILSTVVDDLECPPLHTTDSSELPPTHFEVHKIDLENAILLQELAGLKEEKAELKAQLYLMEKEKSSLDLRLEGKETHENVLRTQIQLLHAELRETKDPSARQTHDGVEDQVCRMSEAEKHRKLIESMRKERRLRTKVSELTNLLEKLNRNCELRLQQSSEFTADLKRANAALMQAIERCKRRTEGKNKRLERQMLTLVETHAAQIRSMKGKISYLEERLAHRASHPSLASETEL